MIFLQNEVLAQMHIDSLTSAPSVIVCLQRENAVKRLLDLLGPSDPKVAKQQDAYHWRALYGSDPIENGLYGTCCGLF